MKLFGKSYKDLAIIGTIVVVLFTYAPNLYNGAEKIFNWGKKYSEVQAAIVDHEKRITNNSSRIDSAEKEIKSWRAVWCISELSKKTKVPAAVNLACQDWIRNP